MNLEIIPKAVDLLKGWENSSEKIEILFDRVVASCVEKRAAVHAITERATAPQKDRFKKAEFERIEKASEWVREYRKWKQSRELIGESSGTQAFLDQLEQPFRPVGNNGETLRRKHRDFPTAKSLRKWNHLYEDNKFALAGNYAACGRPTEIPNPVLLSAIVAHAMLPDLSVQQISQKMKKHEVLSKLRGLSPSTLNHWLRRISKSEWAILQYGEQKYYQTSHGGRSIPAEMPGDLIQVDAGQIKVWVQDPETGDFVYPYLVAAIDVKTRAYLGGILTLDAPTTLETLALLRNILLPRKSPFHQLLVHPKQVQFDNGPIFNNEDIRQALLALNIDYHYIEGSTPTSNAVVERGFRLIGDEFASLFVRYVKDRSSYGGTQDVPAVLFNVLGEELDSWMENYNFARPHSKHGGATPGKIWRDLTTGRFYRPDEDLIREAMTCTLECRVDKNGAVEPVKGHIFDSPETHLLVNEKVTVRITPDLDYDHVYGKIEGEWVKLYSPHSTPGLSKKFAANTRIHKSGLIVARKVMEVLAGTPRSSRALKGKGAQGRKSVKPSIKPPAPTSKKTLKAPQSIGKASAVKTETFTLA